MKETRICPECGNSFLSFPSQAKRCCSRRCAMKRRSRGEGNPRYNGGLCFYKNRWLICCVDGTLMQFARGVMEAELRRSLASNEIVHHINGDSTDDRVENLQVVTRAEHLAIHRPEFEQRRIEQAVAARWGERQAA